MWVLSPIHWRKSLPEEARIELDRVICENLSILANFNKPEFLTEVDVSKVGEYMDKAKELKACHWVILNSKGSAKI